MQARSTSSIPKDGQAAPIVRLTSMTYSGDALGRLDGKVIFVAGGIAGERVRVALTEERRDFARGRVLDVIEPAPERMTPRCRYFGFDETACGGCHWQHVDYAAQLRFKADIVREQLRRIGRLDAAPVSAVRETIPSPALWAYRNHAQFSVTPDGHLGFQAARRQRVIPIDECHVIQPAILEWLLENRTVGAGPSRIGVRAPGLDRPVSEIHVRDATFRVSADSFFQVNPSLIETLLDQVMGKLNLRGHEIVLDAYCGVGLFSRFIAPRARRVIGIESNFSAVADARENLAAWDNVELHAGLIEDLLPQIPDRLDAVVVDPPRAGCGPRVVRALIDRHVDRVVVVSCDPATLARDLRLWVTHGYTLMEVQPIDMFPQTYHIETVTLLVQADRAIL
jgi:23S rRNA (uracil1939-C5)-methyltransferase